MPTQEAALALVYVSPQQLRRRYRDRTIFLTGVTVVASISAVFAWAFGLHQMIAELAATRSNGQWDTFFSTDFLTLCPPFMLASVCALHLVRYLDDLPRGNQQEAAIMAVREAAALGDDRIAPLAEDQLSSVLHDPLPALPAQLGPVRRPNHDEVEFFGTVTVVCFTVGVVGAIVGLLAGTADQDSLAGFWYTCALLGLLLVLAGIWAAWQAQRLSRPCTITANDWGLNWKSNGLPERPVFLPWHEVRSFTLFQSGLARVSGKYVSSQYTFVVDGGSAVLAWYVRRGMTDSELELSDALTHLIFARTSLPLRDISVSAKALTAGTRTSDYRRFMTVLQDKSVQYPANPYLEKLHRPTPSARRYWMLVLALAPALCIPLAWIIAQIMQHW
jgi:hypothetical protein